MAVKRRIKKSVKYGIIVLISLIIITIAVSTFIKKQKEHEEYLASYEYKLGQIGYNEEEIEFLLKQDNNIKDTLLEKEYNEKIIPFLKEKYFILKNLDNYLSYYIKNNSSSLEEIVSIVNVGANNDHYDNAIETNINNYNQMLVNKYNYLKEEFESKEIVDVKNWYCYGENKANKEAYDNFIDMFNAAKENNLKIVITSGYRSYQEQKETYDEYVNRYGARKADALAARPGYSEHETGLALDITTGGATKDTFDTTEEFKWLQENSYKYGFILRYPKDKEKITGFDYEPWHYRYLGKDLAEKVFKSGLTYDEYYAYYLAN